MDKISWFHTKIKNVTYDEATMQSACISDYRSYREIVLKMKDAAFSITIKVSLFTIISQP